MQCPYCHQTDPGSDFCIRCGKRLPLIQSQSQSPAPQPAPGDPPFLPPGKRLRNRYEITSEPPRRHGMGTVYFAIDRGAEDHECVVKQPKNPVTSDAILQKLREEAQRMAALSQRIGGRMPAIMEDFVEDGWFYVVQQRVPGKTLEEVYNDKHPREEKEVIDWAIQCCRVLKLIHEHGVIHRDISPDNLMLTDVGDITFIDFGTLRELQRIISKGTVGIGKFGYSPPEQWSGKPVAQSDIFALGATAYFLLTGFLPPWSEQLQKNGNPQPSDFSPVFPPIRTLNPAVSPPLEAILARALNLTIDKRYQSPEEMRRDLEKLAKHTGPAKSLFCPKCGYENEPHLVYCKKCDSWLHPGSQQCPNTKCKTNKGRRKRPIPGNAKYCPVCGKPTGTP